MNTSNESNALGGNSKLESPKTMNIVVRREIFSYWHGPRNIESSLSSQVDSFWGWQTLSLDARFDRGLDPVLESRSVYGVVHNEAEKFAILRAVYWDHSAERERMKALGFNYMFGMPARFVLVTADQMRDWITRFAGITVQIDPLWGQSAAGSVRRLRIESDYRASSFEKTWTTSAKANLDLDRVWTEIWREMTQCLGSAPQETSIVERYAQPEGIPRYNLKAYDPEAFDRQFES